MPRRPKPFPEVEALEDGGNGGPPLTNPIMDEVEKLMALGEVTLLEEARKAAIRLLVAKLRIGDISAPELAVLRNLLRDNGMIMGFEENGEGGSEGSNPVGFQLPSLEDYSEHED